MRYLRFLFWLICLIPAGGLFAQSTLKVTVLDSLTGEPLEAAAVSISDPVYGGLTDASGTVELVEIADGEYTLRVRYVGFINQERKISFPPSREMVIRMAPEEAEDVIIQSTRTNKTITATPTRIEVLTEEIEEAATMDPARIAHLITHSTGVQVQQTSATSGASNVRIQGLDGRYALFLKDGFPLYGGYSGSLSIMHIPPLDLRQVEYIKGPASTLYGGGAISGLINLISKEPEEEGEFSAMINLSTLSNKDLNMYSSRRIGIFGYSVYGGLDQQSLYDTDDDLYSDLPAQFKANLNPRIYFWPDSKTRIWAGLNFASEARRGGSIALWLNDAEPDSSLFFQEESVSRRIVTQLFASRDLGEAGNLTFRNGFNIYKRDMGIVTAFADTSRFYGRQLSGFNELSWRRAYGRHETVAGLNLYTEQFTEDSYEYIARDFNRLTPGLFVQHNWDPLSRLSLEGGFRLDRPSDYGLIPMPRLSALFRWSPALTSRISGAMGYMMPSIFLSNAENRAFDRVLPVNPYNTQPERSAGGNADVTYFHSIGSKAFVRVNQMFFFNRIDNPAYLAATTSPIGWFEVRNLDGRLESMGFETAIKVGYEPFTLFVGYTFTRAFFHTDFGIVPNVQEQTLTPRHSLKGDLLMDIPGKWQAALDYEYKSSQLLSDGSRTPDLLIFGVVVRRWFGPVQLFFNLENFTDVRQTRYESLLTGPSGTPQFTEVWAPLDGFYINGGLRLLIRSKAQN